MASASTSCAPTTRRKWSRSKATPNPAARQSEEVGVYTVKDDIVTREEFYYDGAFIERPPTWLSAR
jgi:hypothetical protein